MTEPSSTLAELADALHRWTERSGGDSPFATPIEGVFVMRSDSPKPPSHFVQQPSVCVVAQGAKWALFGGGQLAYRAGQALVIAVDTPSTGRVVRASSDEPCLVLAFALDLATLRDVAAAMPAAPQPAGKRGRGVLVTDFDGPLADCALRLVRLFDTPAAISVLYPSLMREICYWLLAGPQAGEVAHLALAGSPARPLIAALQVIGEGFRRTLRVEELARIARLSPSAFHRHFRTLTGLAPLQYQKRLRLLEARRLMVAGPATAEEAAFAVGYESASQFSRDYARLFGAPPKRDANAARNTLSGEPATSLAP
jgi:AraC-like DNA-binding protein